MGFMNYSLVVFIFFYLQGNVQAQRYSVEVTSANSMVNQGDNYVALCNIPGHGALDIISNLKVKWYHNSKHVTNLCTLVESSEAEKYSCKVLSPQPNNISLELTVMDVQKKDVGNLSCEVLEQIKDQNSKWVRDELVAKNSVAIKVREPIKEMSFKFDMTIMETLTLDNNVAPHPLEVLPGMYRPICMVRGSTPPAKIMIMMDNKEMKGRVVTASTKDGIQFVADETEFKGNTQTNIMCKSSVDGLSNSDEQRTFQVVTREVDPKFKCSNDSAIVNNKRHKIRCQVFGVEGIVCNKILWQRGDDGEKFNPGNHENINIECRKVDESEIETTLEILRVSQNDFKTPYRVIYNDPSAKTNMHQLSIPQAKNNITTTSHGVSEYSNSAVLKRATWTFLLSAVYTVLYVVL
ncbi:uncharacterized protein LOC125665761 isoform X2 [Ostrea edulis]|uniref:uncharacterized protein LOC125665761 isoform X2 n=1 Tax=Ostrea edulis TaxID=37623 RepID=UPI0024AF075C|nr:uncharacterized protein LOC125665761 isoform X2 [Ostrea edulis]